MTLANCSFRLQDDISVIPCSCRPRAATTNLSNSCTCGLERFPSARNDAFVDSGLCSYTGDGTPLLQLSDHSSTCEVVQVCSESGRTHFFLSERVTKGGGGILGMLRKMGSLSAVEDRWIPRGVSFQRPRHRLIAVASLGRLSRNRSIPVWFTRYPRTALSDRWHYVINEYRRDTICAHPFLHRPS
ncbi:hypothetical protein TNCV_2382941 [Trichonephila clavipes]|nr:hypothetical protein TNCV_2382941 [Trichonephila clavipes]